MKWMVLLAIVAPLVACGVVGAPVAPETIGVAPVIEQQRLRQEAAELRHAEEAPSAESDQLDPTPQGQDEELLPLRPVGTR
jgi:predicted small lipoprotein YifL